jgi:hypothetical protein
MLIKLVLCALLIIYVNAIHNPCPGNKQEFHGHPESTRSYIQCSKKGEMFVKECPENTAWIESKRRCGETSQNKSQIKKLAAKYKIKKLLAKKSQEELDIESRNAIAEKMSQKVIDRTRAHQTIIERMQHQTQIENQEKLVEKSQAVVDQTRDKQTIDEQKLLEQQLIDQKHHVEQSQAVIDQTRDKQIKHEQNLLSQQLFAQQDLVNRQKFMDNIFKQMSETPKSVLEIESTPEILAPMSERDQVALERQKKLLEQIVQRHDKQQRNFLAIRERMIDNEKSSERKEEIRIKQRLQEQINHQDILLQQQIQLQEKLVSAAEERRNKEIELCTGMVCPENYRCALRSDSLEDLVCKPLKLE